MKEIEIYFQINRLISGDVYLVPLEEDSDWKTGQYS